MKNKFAYNLRNLRLAKGLSQKQLAKKAKVTSSAISQYESETRSPILENILKISKALDVDLHTLVGYKPNSKAVDRIPIQNNDVIKATVFLTRDKSQDSGWNVKEIESATFLGKIVFGLSDDEPYIEGEDRGK